MNLYYTGSDGSAMAFAEEMESSGIADSIRALDGCLRYGYFHSLRNPETVLLIDEWRDQKALDGYHGSPVMAEVARLRDKYDLHTEAERYERQDMPSSDSGFLRK